METAQDVTACLLEREKVKQDHQRVQVALLTLNKTKGQNHDLLDLYIYIYIYIFSFLCWTYFDQIGPILTNLNQFKLI